MAATYTANGPFLSNCRRADAAEALFSASLRCGYVPTGAKAEQAIRDEIGTYGLRWTALRVAGEYGDHPEVAVPRMRRVLAALDEIRLN
jgi:hypothetical protein